MFVNTLRAKDMSKLKNTPLVLCILDGWGHTKETKHNAIAKASTPTWDRWTASYPELLLDASGESVGLPKGQMGNSEVGHTTIGTGRVVLQDLPRINDAIKQKEFSENKALKTAIQALKQTKKTIHIMGLFSEGGVHSHRDHIIALADLFGEEDITVQLHLFLDGRDTPPQSAKSEIKHLEPLLQNKCVKIATVMGRFFAMDRDNRWDRTEAAYEAIVLGNAPLFKSTDQAIDDCYKKDVTDEFIPPHASADYNGMENGDIILMANFRADRVRQILHALTDKTFSSFKRERTIDFSQKIGMKGYSAKLTEALDVLFPPVSVSMSLGEVLSKNKYRQLRIAETEKYAHVTFFFNGGLEDEFPKETRILVPSPKVKTYDLKPEMAAKEITAEVLSAIEKDMFDVIIINYANTDMVGHTGKMAPTIKAVEVIDHALSQLESAVLERDGILLVTADHGNAETMENPKTHQPHTAHTTNPVPFFCVTKTSYKVAHKNGGLKDIAPTILSLLGINSPQEMTGRPLLR